jgi:IS605 OrfB family transposase
MRTAYQYRLRLTATQQATIERWLELARRQYNYRLAERFNWYEQNRCDINACPLICHLPELKDRPDFYSQKRDLVNSKKLFPEYRDLPSHTLQDIIARVEKTFDRWLSGDSNGKRSGKPRFKGQGRCKKAIKRVAKAHLKVSNQRKDFHYKTAQKILSQGKHVAHEKLNIKGLTKSRLAKSVNDAGWGQFLQILSIKAEKAGLLAIAVNPNGTSQDCSNCGHTVKKQLSDRWHSCHNCGCSLDRDHNAAINIKRRAVGHSVLKAQATPDGIPGVTEKPALYA